MGTWRCEKCGYWSAGASPSQFSDDAKNVCHTCIDKSTGRKRYRTIIDTEVYPEGSPYTETSRTRMIEVTHPDPDRGAEIVGPGWPHRGTPNSESAL
jgi:hypothetical protein